MINTALGTVHSRSAKNQLYGEVTLMSSQRPSLSPVREGPVSHSEEVMNMPNGTLATPKQVAYIERLSAESLFAITWFTGLDEGSKVGSRGRGSGVCVLGCKNMIDHG